MTQQVVFVGTVTGDGTGARGQVPWNAFNTNSTELYSKAAFFGVDSGAANAYVVALATLQPQPAVAPTLVAGIPVRFIPTHPSTGPSTLNFAGTGAVSIVNPLGAALTGTEIQAQPIELMYNGTAWQILTPSTVALLNELLTQAGIGPVIYPRTAAEIAASVTPSNYAINSDFLDPRRYGAIGDGVTDDTAALNRWVAVVNASTNPTSFWPSFLTFLCSPLNAITVANFTWTMWSTILVKANSWSSSSHVSVTGTGFRCYELTINGNQFAFSAQPTGQLLSLSGSDVLLDSVSLTASPLVGLQLSSVSKGRFVNCHFDSNCNLGAQFVTSSYLKFTNCTFNYNGYGFQQTLATNTFAAFGFAMRFRSHHIGFVNCEALQNGRDGMNVNQGSYAVKFIGCLSWMNGDGGFTLAADNTSPGTPGNSESPYDIEYVDCEAYNNWSSGLAAYVPVYNVTVDGGRYYNNGRLVGSQAMASSYTNGIYFAAGSIGIRVRAKAYDDRQLCAITVASNPNFATANWVDGTLADYPKVALYNASMVFQGYAMVTAESSQTVTLATLPNNGVTLASIAVGWYISQRTQHNGCFFDNGCTATVDIDGFGQLPGVYGFTGYKTMSGYLANGQNVINNGNMQTSIELLANPSWDASTGSGTSWQYTLPTGASATYFTTAGAALFSPGALALAGGSAASASGDGVLITGGLSYAQDCWFEISVVGYSLAPGNAAITAFYNAGALFSTVVQHPGGGARLLKIGGYLPAGVTQFNLRVITNQSQNCYWDEASVKVMREGYDERDYSYPSRNLPV
jgi:hypothetical protein